MHTEPARLSDITRSHRIDLESKEFVKYLACYQQAHGVAEQACQWYLERWPDSFGAPYIKREQKELALSTKALVPPATTGDAPWAGALTGVSDLMSGFLAIARSQSLLGRIPGLRRIPFNTRIPVENQAASYAWVAQGGPKPVSQMAFGQGVTIDIKKATGIVVFTRELIRLLAPGTEDALRDSLLNGLTTFTDTSFLSTDATVAGTKPAGILNGLTPVTATGDIHADILALLDAFYTARPDAQEVVLIAGPRKAAQIQGGTTWMSGVELPGMGYPLVITSAAGTNVIACDPSAIFYADGGLEIDVSDKAAFQMNSTPDNPATAATVIRSMWQDNLVAFKVERTLNWWAAPTSVAYLAAA